MHVYIHIWCAYVCMSVLCARRNILFIRNKNKFLLFTRKWMELKAIIVRQK